jgi:hypothetical protein
MPEGEKENYLPDIKNQQENMWSERLDCSDLGLQSYVAQHVLDTWKSTSMQFIMHASYYII